MIFIIFWALYALVILFDLLIYDEMNLTFNFVSVFTALIPGINFLLLLYLIIHERKNLIALFKNEFLTFIENLS